MDRKNGWKEEGKEGWRLEGWRLEVGRVMEWKEV